jgi:hypothetical protein
MSVAISFTSYFGDFAVATLIFSLRDFNFFPLSILLVLTCGKAALDSKPGKSLSIHL